MESAENINRGSSSNGENSKEVIKVANKRNVKGSELFLRFLALILTLVASIVVGIDKQTKNVPLPIAPSVYVTVTAKFHYMSALVYFVVANALACSYAAASLLLSLADMTGTYVYSLLIIIFDLVVVALLFSGNGAATAVGVLGYHGNSHVQWNKVCNVFDKFCNQLASAIVLSLLGSLAFFLLVLVAVLNLHKKK